MSTDRYEGWTTEQLQAEREKVGRSIVFLLRLGMFFSTVAAVAAVVALVAKLCGH